MPQGTYKGMSLVRILAAAPLSPEEEDLLLSSAEGGPVAMKRWPRGHSYSMPMKTFTVKPKAEPGQTITK